MSRGETKCEAGIDIIALVCVCVCFFCEIYFISLWSLVVLNIFISHHSQLFTLCYAYVHYIVSAIITYYLHDLARATSNAV
jgi:hypothetical protein